MTTSSTMMTSTSPATVDDDSVPSNNNATPSIVVVDNTMDKTLEHQQQNQQQQQSQQQSSYYYAIVIDSGPIIKQQIHLSNTTKALQYVTVPGVMNEIRDSKSRQYFENNSLWLFENLKIRTPSPKSIQTIIKFAKLTGDYPSLSIVDIQILALTYELEQEGNNGNVLHIRTIPKRTIGLGTIQMLNQQKKNKKQDNDEKKIDDQEKIDGMKQQEVEEGKNEDDRTTTAKPLNIEYDIIEEEEEDDDDGDIVVDEENLANVDDDVDVKPQPRPQSPQMTTSTTKTNTTPSSWAALVKNDATTTTKGTASSTTTKGTASSTTTKVTTTTTSTTTGTDIVDQNMNILFGSMNITSKSIPVSSNKNNNNNNKNEISKDDDKSASVGGQFDDADDDDSIIGDDNDARNEVEGIENDDEFPTLQQAIAATTMEEAKNEDDDDDDEKEDIVGGVDGDDEKEGNSNNHDIVVVPMERTQEEKEKNLQPLSKSGKLYNSFRKYKHLMQPKPSVVQKKKKNDIEKEKEDTKIVEPQQQDTARPGQSKIISAGMMASETMKVEDDDGEGWITSSHDIQSMKHHNGGMLDPSKSNPTVSSSNNNDDDTTSTNPTIANNTSKAATTTPSPPPLNQRTACITTDFAMQNVLLQMNLILLSTNDGMRIRRLKSWVLRCGACYKIHSPQEHGTFLGGRIQRLFCSHCGSDMLQRISASVDGKTGRLKLHFSKRKQGKHLSTRGTKFSLPKPGTGNKYQGDLLLREDQLLMGAWNQKVKIRAGNTYQKSNSESMFGRDLASTVGCNVTKTGGGGGGSFGSSSWTSSTSGSGFASDIRVGFGARKNPNAAKGRERRGKKKKSTDRACGMRRY